MIMLRCAVPCSKSTSRPATSAGNRKRRLSEIMLDRFGGSSGPLYYTASGQRDILVHAQQVASDSPLPSGNALAAGSLFELGSVARARSIIEGFIPSLLRYPHSMSAMIRSATMVEYPALDVRIDTTASRVPCYRRQTS